MKKGGVSALVSSALLLAALVAPNLAHADGTLAMVCDFDAVSNEWTTPMQYLSGDGRFDFMGTADCVGEHNGLQQVFQGLQFAAYSHYYNQLCGTGYIAVGIDLINNGSELLGAGGSTGFTAGQGALQGYYDGAGPFDGHHGKVTGYLTLTPGPQNQSSLPPAGPCATQFRVRGALVFALPDTRGPLTLPD